LRESNKPRERLGASASCPMPARSPSLRLIHSRRRSAESRLTPSSTARCRRQGARQRQAVMRSGPAVSTPDGVRAPPSLRAPRLLRRTTNEVEFHGPGKETCGRLLALLVGLRALQPVKNLVAIVDAGTALVFAQQRHRVTERADDTTVTQMQLRLYAIFARLRHSKRPFRVLASCSGVPMPSLSGVPMPSLK